MQAGEKKWQITSTFCSIRTLKGSDDAHPHWERQSTLLSQVIQMLISPEDTLRYLQIMLIWAPQEPVKLTCRMSHYRYLKCILFIH